MQPLIKFRDKVKYNIKGEQNNDWFRRLQTV
jgi:hypothetical protein